MSRTLGQSLTLTVVGILSLVCFLFLWLYGPVHGQSDSQHGAMTETYGVFGYYLRSTPHYFVSIVMPVSGGLPNEDQGDFMARWFAEHPPPEPKGEIDTVGLTLTLLATVEIFALF